MPSHEQSGHSCLQQSIGWPGTTIMRLLLATARARGQTAALLRMGDEDGENVFHYCAWRGESRGTTQLSVVCECIDNEFRLPKVNAVYDTTTLPRALAELVVGFTPFSELVDARDMLGRTPLMAALTQLNPDRPENTMASVKLLVQHGADPDARDKDGYTAFELCGFRIYKYRLRHQESPHQGWNPADAEF